MPQHSTSVWTMALVGALVAALAAPAGATAADLPAFLGDAAICRTAGGGLGTAFESGRRAIATPTCGPVCTGNYLMPPSGTTLAAGATCATATSNLDSVLLASANDECMIDTGRNSCDVSYHIVTPCYQLPGGTLWYVGGYAAYSCRDTTC